MNTDIKLLLVEDQTLMRQGLRTILTLEPGLTVIGEAGDGEEGVKLALTLRPDVILMDVQMPRRNGVEATGDLVGAWPAAKVIILTTFDRDDYVFHGVRAGAMGYLLKDAPAEELAEALRKVHRGGRAIDPQLALEAWSEQDPLNDRERQVLRLAGEGLSAGEIAGQLNLSQGTVRNYLSEAIGKLGVGNRIEAYRLARQKGWL